MQRDGECKISTALYRRIFFIGMHTNTIVKNVGNHNYITWCRNSKSLYLFVVMIVHVKSMVETWNIEFMCNEYKGTLHKQLLYPYASPPC